MARQPKSANAPTKAQMVRDAIDALGGDAKPMAIQDKIKELFGIEISTGMIASYKSNMKKGGSSAASGRKGGGGSVNVNDLEAIKSLVNRLGANQLHALINVLSK
jgi:hypothetical protein